VCPLAKVGQVWDVSTVSQGSICHFVTVKLQFNINLDLNFEKGNRIYNV